MAIEVQALTSDRPRAARRREMDGEDLSRVNPANNNLQDFGVRDVEESSILNVAWWQNVNAALLDSARQASTASKNLEKQSPRRPAVGWLPACLESRTPGCSPQPSRKGRGRAKLAGKVVRVQARACSDVVTVRPRKNVAARRSRNVDMRIRTGLVAGRTLS